MDVRWEGPAVYRATVEVPEGTHWLHFLGASYAAEVWAGEDRLGSHRGIWDSFAFRLPTGRHEIRVEVTKNGGPSYPVRSTLAGFLPYVFQTFGGLYRGVELVPGETDPSEGPPAARPRVRAEGSQLLADGAPWSPRGVLTWGWYPELGAPNPGREALRQEFARYRELGFNLVKFCLWLPPHEAFDVLEELGMWAWVELPLWMPEVEGAGEAMLEEAARIVRQYRRHSRIAIWTCGCELDRSVPDGFRRVLYETVRSLTGAPLVKDSSGGAEMYGGGLAEAGTFHDFHPYCEAHYAAPMLESLSLGPRPALPVLLGETLDFDAYRPLAAFREEHPYWASADQRLNDQGVRWQYDLPTATTRRSAEEEEALRAWSLERSRWVRRRCLDALAACGDVAGYVLTGACDTPVSSSGVVEAGVQVGATEAFVVPHRAPAWVRGGNRPAWHDPACGFVGPWVVQVGLRSEHGGAGTLVWRAGGAEGRAEARLDPGRPTVACVAEFALADEGPAELAVEFDGLVRSFRLWAFEPLPDAEAWEHPDYGGRRAWGMPLRPGANFLDREGTVPCPFWRECVLMGSEAFPHAQDHELLAPVAPDCAIDPEWLEQELPGAEWLLTRVDTRTYREAPYLARKDGVAVTTLRPQGGLGSQPAGLARNPAGHFLLRLLARLAE